LDIVDKVSKRSLDMIEFYLEENRDYDRDMMISIEMIRYFIPLLEERGYNEKAEELQLRMDSLLGPQESGGLRPTR